MSEHKIRELAQKLAEAAADQKGLIAIGFEGYRLACMSKDAPDIQVRECRLAFFAGAHHLYTSIMGILAPGLEPTEDDLRRMDGIYEELMAFARAVELGEPD